VNFTLLSFNHHFGMMNLSPASCSQAALVSVSIQHGKNQFEKLYFKTVKKSDHIQIGKIKTSYICM